MYVRQMGHAMAAQIPQTSPIEDHNVYRGLFNLGWNTAGGSVECLCYIQHNNKEK
jgi:hypothetical protein